MLSEGETDAHLKGKRLLAGWERELGHEAQIEAYLSDLKQRPDILVERAGRSSLALEYQCAPITCRRLAERSEGYRKAGLGFCWILGMNYRLNGTLPEATAKFMRFDASLGFYLIFLDSERERIEIDYAIQKADFLPVRYHRRYFGNLGELRDFLLGGSHRWKLYQLNEEQRREQIRKMESRLHFSRGRIRDIQVECYRSGYNAGEAISTAFQERYYYPIYREDRCYWNCRLRLNAGCPDPVRTALEVREKSCYDLPFVPLEDFVRADVTLALENMEL